MARDYAARNRKPAPKPAGLPGWVWLTAGLSMGLVVAVLVYIGRDVAPMPLSTPPSAKTRPAQKIVIPPAEDPRFDFYTMLENEQVVPAREDRESAKQARTPPPKTEPAKPAAPAAPAATPPPAAVVASAAPAAAATSPAAAAAAAPAASAENAQYLIVLGAFRDQANADGHRAKLALAGAEAQVEKFTAGNGQTLYRVRVGPEKGLSQAQSTLAQLKSSGFDGRVVKLN